MDYEHNYSDVFYSYIERGSMSSAEAIFPILDSNIRFGSIVDVGCGRGAWLSVFKKLGGKLVTGIDGDYVSKSSLLIDSSEFFPHNLSTRLSLDKRFDLAMSLEVAEHIPIEAADIFIDNLIELSNVVIFSAAVIGQGGEYHVNEQPLEFWKEKFEKRGYACYDFLRTKVCDNSKVMPWYKNNILVYANEAGRLSIETNALQSIIPIGSAIPYLGSRIWLLRLFLVRNLPVWFTTFLAQANSVWVAIKYKL